jgi:hypothetical protein
MKIYKYTCVGDSSTSVQFAFVKDEFEEEMKENEKSDFDISEDEIAEIEIDIPVKYSKEIAKFITAINYEFDIGHYTKIKN